jgi:hypothetical protein
MDDLSPGNFRWIRRASAMVVALGCLLSSGCASALLQPWSSRPDERAVANAAADDAFPTAEEVGLAGNK